MPVKSFTKRWLDSLRPPPKTVLYFDKNIKNLVLRHHPSNKKSFYICSNTNGLRTYRFIGTYPSLQPNTVKSIVKVEVAKSYIDLIIQPQAIQKYKSFKFYMDKFMDEHVHDLKPTTIKLYNTLLKSQIYPTFQGLPITEIVHNNIVQFKQKLKDKTTTYNRCHQLLNTLFKYCQTHDIIKFNPLMNIKKYKENTRQDYLSQSQYKDFIQSTYELLESKKISLSSAYCILFILLTGCRSSEAYTLKHEYIDFKNAVILLPDSKTGKKKIFLSDSLRRLLQSIPKTKNNNYVFIGRHGRSHIVNLAKPFKKILEHARITNKIVIHSLRHSYISTGANAGLSLQSIQMAIQHQSLASTQQYAHLSDSVGQNTAKQVGDIISKPSEDILAKIFTK